MRGKRQQFANFFVCASVFRGTTLILAAFLLQTLLCFADELSSSPSPFITAWQKLPFAKARLIAQKNSDGQLSAGLELVLEDGAHTYWRTPGEVGVPPVFSFAGSQNIANIMMDYPVPSALDEGGSKAFGYRDHVVWPIHFVVLDKTKPVDLALFAKLAICAKICVPVEAKFSLLLNADLPVGGANLALGVALAKVPKFEPFVKDIIIQPKVKDAACLRNNLAGQKPKFFACWQISLPQNLVKNFANPAALFVEGPDEQWLFDTIAAPANNDGAQMLIRLLQKPDGDASRFATTPKVTLTLASDPPIETQLVLPAPPAEN